MIFLLAWRNLWRNRRRTLITAGSITFAAFLAITMQSLQMGVFDNLVKNMVNYYSGFIQVHTAGYWEERILDNTFSSENPRLIELDSLPGVLRTVPRLETFLLASKDDRTKPAFLCGTDPAKERMMTRLDTRVVKGEYLSDSKDNAVLIGEGLSAKLELGVGDTLVLLGQGMYGSVAAGKYRIKGLLKLGAPELNDVFIVMDLKQAQELLSAPGLLTALAVEPDDPEMLERRVNTLAYRMGEGYEVMSWKSMMPEVWNHIRVDTNSLYVMMGFLYLIIAFGMFGTILMMTNERKYEFGMLVAIGMRKGRLALIVLTEILMLAFLGGLTGMLLSWPVVYYLQEFPIRLSGEMESAFIDYGFEPVFPAQLNPDAFIEQTAIVLGLSILMALYPLYRIRKMDPTSLIRR